jgi:hypothetical protein
MTDASAPELGLDFIARVMAGMEKRAPAASDPPSRASGHDPRMVPYLHAAAVLVSFDPDTLSPVGGGPPDPELARGLLDYSKLVLDEERQTRWTLRVEHRRRALQELAAQPDGLRKAIAANPELQGGAGDALHRTLRAALEGRLPPAREQNAEQLAATVRLHDWLEGVVHLQPLQAYRQRLELVTLLEPFRHLTGRQVNGRWVDYFRGREAELARLRRYAGVVSHGVVETITQSIPQLLPIPSLRKQPPLLIHGPGGMGKSTLLARFLLQHAEALASDRFPFVYLDFDRPGISAQEPLTLLVEAARQLAVQYPASAPEPPNGKPLKGPDKGPTFEGFHRRWQEELARSAEHRVMKVSRDSARVSSMRRRRRKPAIEEFARAFKKLPVSGKPLLLVLDTFEEVQYRSRDQVGEVYALLEALQEEIPFLRTVLAGRAPITEFTTDSLLLGELDREAAHGFLASQGILDRRVAETVVRHVGGNPLSLRLATDLVQREGTIKALEQELDPGRRLLVFRQRFEETEVQGRLFRRILNHIHNLEVRRLAHPGMVLRRVTPELIRQVLAEPCGVSVPDDDRARALFDELGREVSLVMPATDGALQPRPDVREAMLGLIQAAQPEQVEQIHAAAVRYYRGRKSVADRAEEIYHRLAGGEPPGAVNARWLPGIESLLTRSIGELPPRAQAYLASRAGIALDDEIWSEADLEDWEAHAARRAADLLQMGRADDALAVVRERTERSANSPLVELESIAREQSARDDAEGDLLSAEA